MDLEMLKSSTEAMLDSGRFVPERDLLTIDAMEAQTEWEKQKNGKSND